MKKIVCVYHSIDLDGWMSAAIVKHWFITEHKEDHLEYEWLPKENRLKAFYKGALKFEYPEITFLGWNYGDSIPDLSGYDKVIMCDISFPSNEISKLVKRLGLNFIWIDHHISAIKENECIMMTNQAIKVPIKISGLRDPKFAACELTWKYFMSNPIEKFGEIEDQEPMPEIVKLLGMYDSFRHKGTDEEKKVLEFQYGARSVISNYQEAYKWLRHSLGLSSWLHIIETPVDFIWEKGIAIYEYLCKEAQQVYKNRFELLFFEDSNGEKTIGEEAKKFICFNKERFNPVNFEIDYHKDGYDGAASFHYVNGVMNFSLYNDDGKVDCSQIAKQYGGGGHKGAAGFRITLNEFIKLCQREN